MVQAREVAHEVPDVGADAVVPPLAGVDRDLHRGPRGRRLHRSTTLGAAAMKRGQPNRARRARAPASRRPSRPEEPAEQGAGPGERRADGEDGPEGQPGERGRCASGSTGGGCGGTRAARGAGAFAMLRPRWWTTSALGVKHDPPARRPQAEAEVRVLLVEEEALVEAAHRRERLPPGQEARARDPAGLLLASARLLGPSQRPGIGAARTPRTSRRWRHSARGRELGAEGDLDRARRVPSVRGPTIPTSGRASRSAARASTAPGRTSASLFRTQDVARPRRRRCRGCWRARSRRSPGSRGGAPRDARRGRPPADPSSLALSTTTTSWGSVTWAPSAARQRSRSSRVL